MDMRKTICRIFGGIFLCMILFNVSVNADAAKNQEILNTSLIRTVLPLQIIQEKKRRLKYLKQ